MVGIESSFDDTAVAVLDTRTGAVRASLVERQVSAAHGTIPLVAGEMHRAALPRLLARALAETGATLADVGAVACTVGPGLGPSLSAGLDFGRSLAQQTRSVFLPVHHMEAHALTARMEAPVDFPFLVLLASGGHCLLLLAERLGVYQRLGTLLDDSPGEAMDKVARALGLDGGGAALERAAAAAAVRAASAPLLFSPPLARERTCDFSFAGLKGAALRHVYGGDFLGSSMNAARQDTRWARPSPADAAFRAELAAAFQQAVVRHITVRTHRALLYLRAAGPWPTRLVASGGVLCNARLREQLGNLCDHFALPVVFPRPALCTDNAAMIAWVGHEYLRDPANPGAVILQPESPALAALRYQTAWPLGTDVSARVRHADILLRNQDHTRIVERKMKKPRK